MPAGLDSGAVLRAFADHPDAFPALRGDVAEFARKSMVKQLKDKALTLDGLRLIHRAGGGEMLSAVLDSWEATELAGLAKKADGHGPYARAGDDAAAARRHLLDLAAGRIGPSGKAEKVKAEKETRAAKAPKSKIGAVLQSKVHSGVARPSRTKRAP